MRPAPMTMIRSKWLTVSSRCAMISTSPELDNNTTNDDTHTTTATTTATTTTTTTTTNSNNNHNNNNNNTYHTHIALITHLLIDKCPAGGR